MKEAIEGISFLIRLLGTFEKFSNLFSFFPRLLLLSEFSALMRVALRHVASQCLRLFKEFVFADRASEQLLNRCCFYLCGTVHLFANILGLGSYPTGWRFFGRTCSQCFFHSWGRNVTKRHLSDVCRSIWGARFISECDLDLLSKSGPAGDIHNFVCLLWDRNGALAKIILSEIFILIFVEAHSITVMITLVLTRGVAWVRLGEILVDPNDLLLNLREQPYLFIFVDEIFLQCKFSKQVSTEA